MIDERILLDTAFIQALLVGRDKYHSAAASLLKRIQKAHTVLVTDAVLLEVGNALAVSHRDLAVGYIRYCQSTPNVTIIRLNEVIFEAALDLYQNRPDKQWGLTDCISFIVMQREGITLAATADQHFVQAGFRALMLE